MKKFLIALGVVVFIMTAYVWSAYNKLITVNEAVDTQWAQVEAQYQRRFDLIPNLVASVKGAMEQEQEVFGRLADARSKYAGAVNTNEKAAAAGQMESALARLLVIMENYPELKSIDTVQSLMAQLEGTENRVSVERVRFNDASREFNVMAKRIPSKWVASWMGLDERAYFEATAGAESAPKVEL